MADDLLQDWNRLVPALREALARELPGTDAQADMAPVPRRGWRPGELPDEMRDAAVLVLVYPVDVRPTFVLTRRTETVDHHRGQVSLPGGAFEPGEDAETCALRECEEEVGVDLPDARILGHLTPLHVPVSGFLVRPVVAALSRRPSFRARPEEVASIHEVPIADLADPATAREDRVRDEAGGFWKRRPWLALDGLRVWGATAMMLAELRAVLGTLKEGET
jgi:8-oxo-dGTP pyrophosphatase MutT (NUDIX family)